MTNYFLLLKLVIIKKISCNILRLYKLDTLHINIDIDNIF